MGIGKHGKEHTLTNLSQSHILKQGGGMEMQDLEKIGKDLLQGANGKALREAAASPEAQRLSRTLDRRRWSRPPGPATRSSCGPFCPGCCPPTKAGRWRRSCPGWGSEA